MFVPKSPQGSIFDHDIWMSPKKLNRLKKSWAGPFREHIFPLIVESETDFASIYSPDMGAPNKPVSVLLGLLILKEMNDLTDRETLFQFEFHMQWHFALDTPSDQAIVSERTLFYFRKHITEDEKVYTFFKKLIDRVIETWSIKTGKHRMDSTVIMSNMKILTRLQLFIRTIQGFLKKLKKNHPMIYRSLPDHFHERYMER